MKIEPLLKSNLGQLKIIKINKNLRVMDNKGIMFFPIVKDYKKIYEIVKLCFGEKYGMFFKKYYYIKKFIFINPYFNTGVQKIDNSTGSIAEISKNVLNKVTPTYFINTDINTIVDLSSIISTIPSDNDYFKSNKILSDSEYLYPELIFGLIGGVQLSYHLSKFKPENYSLINVGNKKFDKFIIPINISTDNQEIVNKILHPDANIPRHILSKEETLIPASIFKFLIKDATRELNEDPRLEAIGNLMDSIRIVFLFYTGNSGFYYDPLLSREEGINYKEIISRMKKCLKVLISRNTQEDVNNDIIDVKDSNNIDRIITLSANASSDNKIIDDPLDPSKNISPNIEENDNISNNIDPMNEIYFSDKDSDKSLGIEFEEEEEIEEIEDEEEIEKEILLEIDKKQTPKMTKKQEERLETAKNRYKSIQMKSGRTIEEILNDTEATNITHKTSSIPLADKTFSQTTLIDVEKSYISKTLEKDIVSVVSSFSEDKNIDMHVTNVNIIDSSNQFNNINTYELEFMDSNLKRHKIKIDIPKPDEDGFYYLGGNKSLLKSQELLLPIVKVQPTRVIVTSNFTKCLVERSGTILNREVIAIRNVIANHNEQFKNCKIHFGNNIRGNETFLTTLEYDELAKIYSKIIFTKGNNKTTYYFSQKEIRDIIDKKKYKLLKNALPIGIDSSGMPIVVNMEKDNKVSTTQYIISDMINHKILDNIEEIIMGVKTPKRRIYSSITYMNKKIPVILFLGSIFGLSDVIKRTGAKIDILPRLNRDDTRPYIKFNDSVMYFDAYPFRIPLLLNGLDILKPHLYSFTEFDTTLPYIEYLYSRFKSRNAIKYFKDAKDVFLDPITKEILKDMNLPTDFMEVFLYSSDLLADNDFIKEQSHEAYRIRKHEIVPALLYKAMAEEYCIMNKKMTVKESISVKQDKVILDMQNLQIFELNAENSPINDMKNKSIVTYKGPEGIRGADTVSKEKRSYDSSSRGVVSVSTVDNQSVGIMKQMTINSNIKSTRGYIEITDEKDVKKLGYSQITSPEEAILPYAGLHDDPKRLGFASIQTKHIIHTNGYSHGLVGTGYDKVLHEQVTSDFVKRAKGNGKVIKHDIDKKLVIVEYKDGTIDNIEYGSDKFNKTSNIYLENHLACDLSEGDTIKEGEPIIYNKDFFKKNQFGNLQYCVGTIGRIALFDSSHCSEDSSLVSEYLSERMVSGVVKRKQIVLHFNSNIIKDLKIGDKVLLGDSLITFEEEKDSEASNNEIQELLGDIDEETLDSLHRHKAKSPISGTIKDIKVYWTLPDTEFSESLFKYIQSYKRKIRTKIKDRKNASSNNSFVDLERMIQVSTPKLDRLNGAFIPKDGGILIEYFIARDEGLGEGDKLSYYSALKSIIGYMTPKELTPYTENGEKIDAVIGGLSVNARMITSIIQGGYLGKILQDYGKKIAIEYLGK